MKPLSRTQRVAQLKAIQFGENLMPQDCMDILISVYGEKRMDMMLFDTIVNKLVLMMCVIVDGEDYRGDCEQIVSDFMVL